MTTTTYLDPHATTTDRTTTVGALIGAVLGAAAGAVLWAAVGKATGGVEFKYGAVVIGALTGGGAALFGRGHSHALGVIGAVFGLAGILVGKVLFELLVHPDWELAQHIAYHVTPVDFVFYAATLGVGFAVAGTHRAADTLDKIRAAVPFFRR